MKSLIKSFNKVKTYHFNYLIFFDGNGDKLIVK